MGKVTREDIRVTEGERVKSEITMERKEITRVKWNAHEISLPPDYEVLH